MIMEFLPGGDLMGLLMKRDTFDEAATKQYAAELVMAITFVHSLGYIHRDLKPDNILLDWDGHLKLTDMGLCKKVVDSDDDLIWEGLDVDEAQQTQPITIPAMSLDSQHPASLPTHRLAYSTVGTPDYISPEVILKKGYGMDCDWWSLGIILYECLVGHTPFFDKTPVDTCRRILRWEHFYSLPREVARVVTPECADFLSSLITGSSRRLGRDGSQSVREHPWFRGIDWATLREQPAPFVPPGSSRIRRLVNDLSQVDLKSSTFPSLLRSVTSNFDKFDDANHMWGKDNRATVTTTDRNQFIGYTFRRKKDTAKTPSTMLLSAFSTDSNNHSADLTNIPTPIPTPGPKSSTSSAHNSTAVKFSSTTHATNATIAVNMPGDSLPVVNSATPSTESAAVQMNVFKLN